MVRVTLINVVQHVYMAFDRHRMSILFPLKSVSRCEPKMGKIEHLLLGRSTNFSDDPRIIMNGYCTVYVEERFHLHSWYNIVTMTGISVFNRSASPHCMLNRRINPFDFQTEPINSGKGLFILTSASHMK